MRDGGAAPARPGSGPAVTGGRPGGSSGDRRRRTGPTHRAPLLSARPPGRASPRRTPRRPPGSASARSDRRGRSSAPGSPARPRGGRSAASSAGGVARGWAAAVEEIRRASGRHLLQDPGSVLVGRDADAPAPGPRRRTRWRSEAASAAAPAGLCAPSSSSDGTGPRRGEATWKRPGHRTPARPARTAWSAHRQARWPPRTLAPPPTASTALAGWKTPGSASPRRPGAREVPARRPARRRPMDPVAAAIGPGHLHGQLPSLHQEGHPDLPAARGHHRRRRRRLGRRQGHPASDDGRLLGGDLVQAGPQVLLVVVVDPGHHRHPRRPHVGGVPPPAEPHLHHRRGHPVVPERGQGDGGHGLEEGGLAGIQRRSQPGHQRGQRLRRDRLPVQADPLPEVQAGGATCRGPSGGRPSAARPRRWPPPSPCRWCRPRGSRPGPARGARAGPAGPRSARARAASRQVSRTAKRPRMASAAAGRHGAAGSGGSAKNASSVRQEVPRGPCAPRPGPASRAPAGTRRAGTPRAGAGGWSPAITRGPAKPISARARRG